MGDWGRRVLQAWQGIHLGGVQQCRTYMEKLQKLSDCIIDN